MKTQIEVSKEKEKEDSTLHQKGHNLIHFQGGRRRQDPVFKQSVMDTAWHPWVPQLREKGLIFSAVFEPS